MEIDGKKKYFYKYIIAGNGGSGKSTMIKKFVEGTFDRQMELTVGIDFSHKEYILEEQINNHLYIFHLQLWDFGGQDRFRFILDAYLKGSRGVIFLFDLTSNPIEKDFKDWISLIYNESQNIPIVVVGSKSDMVSNNIIDLKMKIVREIFDDLKNDFPLINVISYSTCSSKLGSNIDYPFRILTKYIFNQTRTEKESLEVASLS